MAHLTSTTLPFIRNLPEASCCILFRFRNLKVFLRNINTTREVLQNRSLIYLAPKKQNLFLLYRKMQKTKTNITNMILWSTIAPLGSEISFLKMLTHPLLPAISGQTKK